MTASKPAQWRFAFRANCDRLRKAGEVTDEVSAAIKLYVALDQNINLNDLLTKFIHTLFSYMFLEKVTSFPVSWP